MKRYKWKIKDTENDRDVCIPVSVDPEWTLS